MTGSSLYPFRFQPLFKSAIWGGNRLRPLFGLEGSNDLTGEVWLLSDQGENQTVVLEGSFKGIPLRRLMQEHSQEILGYPVEGATRFPLLCKIIDAKQPLSVQVHPNDEQAIQLSQEKGLSTTDLGKTEAWVVMEAEANSSVYVGLKPGVTKEQLERSIPTNEMPQLIHRIRPSIGDCYFLQAGTIHAIGAGMMLFEVQQTSDITYRLYDWGRVDAKTGKPRQLHIEESLRCTDFGRGPGNPIPPVLERNGSYRYERLISCDYFSLHRWIGSYPFLVGSDKQCRIVFCMEGNILLRSRGLPYPMKRGDIMMIPASVGPCECFPEGKVVVLECGIPLPKR